MQFLIVIPLEDELLQEFRAFVTEVQLEYPNASVVSFFHDPCL